MADTVAVSGRTLSDVLSKARQIQQRGGEPLMDRYTDEAWLLDVAQAALVFVESCSRVYGGSVVDYDNLARLVEERR